MGIEHELKDAISNTEQLIGQISQMYRSGIRFSLAKDAVDRAHSVLATNDEPAMQHAWVEVTVAQAALSAQTYARCKELQGAPSLNRAIIESKMDVYLASTQAALRQLLANETLLGPIPDIQLPDAAVISLAEATGKDAAKFIDSAAAWIFSNQDKMIAAAKAKADAKASASANSASGGSQKHKL
ncbi:hypothetical protein W7K_17895 [Stenotrophomonas geniculata N1]|uniref:Uncharacterized protein n=2 Tax=Stenotrophomonas geniculata TaxID=86188 RepID=A0A0L8A615_9GAMM|nr:hypothetical protein W7K_17895 [Stenotrophomonas geniculata N1]